MNVGYICCCYWRKKQKKWKKNKKKLRILYEVEAFNTKKLELNNIHRNIYNKHIPLPIFDKLNRFYICAHTHIRLTFLFNNKNEIARVRGGKRTSRLIIIHLVVLLRLSLRWLLIFLLHTFAHHRACVFTCAGDWAESIERTHTERLWFKITKILCLLFYGFDFIIPMCMRSRSNTHTYK